MNKTVAYIFGGANPPINLFLQDVWHYREPPTRKQLLSVIRAKAWHITRQLGGRDIAFVPDACPVLIIILDHEE